MIIYFEKTSVYFLNKFIYLHLIQVKSDFFELIITLFSSADAHTHTLFKI